MQVWRVITEESECAKLSEYKLGIPTFFKRNNSKRLRKSTYIVSVYELISSSSMLSYSKLCFPSISTNILEEVSAPFPLIPSSFPTHCWVTFLLSLYLATHKMPFLWQIVLFSREEAISSSFSPSTTVFLLKGYDPQTANKAQQSASAWGTEKWPFSSLERQ